VVRFLKTNQKYSTFKELTNIYSKIAYNCGKKAKIYVPSHTRLIEQSKYELKKHQYPLGLYKEYWTKSSPITFEQYYDDQILDARCNNWYCARCRPRLQRKLHQQIVQNLLVYESIMPMRYHWIWTFPGNELRRKVDYQKSYDITQYEWNKVLTRLNYEYTRYQKGLYVRKHKEYPLLMEFVDPPENTIEHQYNPEKGCNDFALISLPRSQNHPFNESNEPGYCHLHNISNISINPHWLENLKDKLKYQIGFQWIKPNQEVHEYLANDFFDDEEFVIPIGKRHVNHTINIRMDLNEYQPEYQCQAFPVNQVKYRPYNKMTSRVYNHLITNRITKIYNIFGEIKECKDFVINPPVVNLLEEFYKNIEYEGGDK
jgi:hypothetical protein